MLSQTKGRVSSKVKNFIYFSQNGASTSNTPITRQKTCINAIFNLKIKEKNNNPLKIWTKAAPRMKAVKKSQALTPTVQVKSQDDGRKQPQISTQKKFQWSLPIWSRKEKYFLTLNWIICETVSILTWHTWKSVQHHHQEAVQYPTTSCNQSLIYEMMAKTKTRQKTTFNFPNFQRPR